MPNLTSPRVCQLPNGAGARLAGLNKLFFWDLSFGESVLTAVLHWSQHRPGSPKQAQTWPNGFTYSIVYFPTHNYLRFLRGIVCWPGPT
jgi:hypothetical protein